MSDDNAGSDEELAPMVDGLSGALCIFILVTTVFMIGGIDTVVTGTGLAYTDKETRLDLSNNTVFFSSGLSLSREDYAKISSYINNSVESRVVLTASSSRMFSFDPVKTKRMLTYNLLEFRNGLNLKNKKVILSVSDDDICEIQSSCIRWSNQ
ncbi:hypothetical protein CC235_24690 [Salmonella enterica subsp. enterica serovar Kentucky]|nr:MULTISPECIES: hypothetical protein [Enterobacteriaceae]EBT1611885.1 hypothetical protein [Salmonella enterica subsp. enterica serovar Alachua]ECY0468272.1 hypothetical protein [Salmonella enterica subsp. enterica]EDK7605802.1 hypothetical protein [Salmonella enterica subsp. enterica serovar Typhimurium]EEJ1610358.1 hypothetical protein [Salmonella enterica subsp. enterica serovar 6,8:i:-]KNI45795.1 hypothetical protein AEU14_14895 [Salmonella enterica subsp. enterica serovar 8,(20):-:z6]HD